MTRIKDIVVDCAQPASLARFWAEVLDGYSVASYDEAELERLRDAGIDDPEDDPSVLVVADAGRPRFFFTLVPEPKATKNRIHFDLTADDYAADLARLTRLGARVVAEQAGWTTLEDPEGNEFDLLK